MAKSGVIDEITAHRALEGLPEVWADLAQGRIGRAEALEQARQLEPVELAERTARMLTLPTAAESQARLRALLDAHEAGLRPKPRSRRWLHGGAVALAAAAAVLLFVVVREPPERPFDADYGIELFQWVAVERGPSPETAKGEVWTYRMDRPIEIKLRPGPRVSTVIDVRAFAQRGSEAAIALPIEPVMLGGGVVEIQGLPSDWGLEPGRWRLTLVVGPPDGLPRELANVRTDEAAPYDVQSTWVEIEESAPEIP